MGNPAIRGKTHLLAAFGLFETDLRVRRTRVQRNHRPVRVMSMLDELSCRSEVNHGEA